MTKMCNRLFALVLSFAMVFTSIVWLGTTNANAATELSNYTFAAQVVDADGNPVNGVVVKGYTDNGATPVTVGGYDSSFNWVETPVALTSADGEVTLSLSKLGNGFTDKDLSFVVEDENYVSEDVHVTSVVFCVFCG